MSDGAGGIRDQTAAVEMNILEVWSSFVRSSLKSDG